jgi:putative flippase GtrA
MISFFRRFVFFVISGVVGFCVDVGILYLLKETAGLVIGRLFSFFCAVLSTWLVNRTLTFQGRSSHLPLHREFLHYLALMLLGGVCNYLTYLWLIHQYPLMYQHPVIAIAAGALVGLLVNWTSTHLVLFKKKDEVGTRENNW